MDYVDKLLPPLVTNVIGIIPLILKNSPITYPKHVREYVIVVFSGVVWLGYFITIELGYQIFFAQLFTIATLFLSLIFFLIVLYRILQNESANKFRLTFIYVLGILFITAAFTNYSEPVDKVFIIVKSVNHDVRLIYLRTKEREANNDKIAKLHLNQSLLNSELRGCWIQISDTSNIESIEFCAIDDKQSSSDNTSICQTVHVLKKEDIVFGNLGRGKVVNVIL